MKNAESFLASLRRSLDAATLAEFTEIDAITLVRAMDKCGMDGYPQRIGRFDGERASGEQICEVCGQDYYSHPLDWRIIGYGNVPFLNILCTGERVKL